MDNYVVGSVADFISQSKGINIKSKKSKSGSDFSKKDTNIKPEKISVKKDILVKKSSNISKQKSNKKRSENFSSTDDEFKSKKPIEEILNLNQVPSDSEDEDIENMKEDPKKRLSSKNLNDSVENTVFVGNIPINYDKKKVYKVFSKFGKIQSARIRCVPIADINMSKKVAAVKKQFNPHRHSLVAYVKFYSKDSANAALKANGMVIDGHHLRVDLAESNKEKDNNKAIFVGGLPFNIEDDELWEFFKNCGKINSVRVIRDSQTSMGKGFGYVNFDSTAAVELALQMNGQELKKRVINIQRCVSNKKKTKSNLFGKKKSNEMVDKLLAKKLQKRKKKAEKQNNSLKKKSFSNDYQGKTANMKKKKKKKISKTALQKKKIIKILGSSK